LRVGTPHAENASPAGSGLRASGRSEYLIHYWRSTMPVLVPNEAIRLEIHDPKKDQNRTPKIDELWMVYSKRIPATATDAPYFIDTGEHEVIPLMSKDPEVPDCPMIVEALMKRGDFESARNLANAWYVGLAHLHGYWHVTLGPSSSGAK
jgi:hypothetical protein